MARPIYKQSVLARTAFYVLLAGFFMVFPAQSRAESNPAYTVEGVEVDVVAENAVKAREKAVDEAQVKAYQMLAERFLGAEAMKTFQTPDPVTVSSLVQDFEVTKEQLSKKRYKGTYTVRFRPNTFKGSMAAKGISYSDVPKKPVLVLPFYQSGGKTVLWSETNPWMNAWRSFASATATVVPLGDANDIAQVNDSDALDYDPVQVQELAQRYGADDVAVLLASPEPTATSGRVVVNVYKNGFEGPAFVQKIVVDQQADENDVALYARAAEQVRTLLGQNWKANAAYNPAIPAPQTTTTVTTTNYNQAQIPVTQQPAPVPYTRTALGPSRQYPARARFSSVQDWVRMKNTLDRVYGMQSVMIKSLKSREALLDMRYAGDVSALQLSLQNAGIMMRGAPDGTLEIYTGAASTPIYR